LDEHQHRQQDEHACHEHREETRAGAEGGIEPHLHCGEGDVSGEGKQNYRGNLVGSIGHSPPTLRRSNGPGRDQFSARARSIRTFCCSSNVAQKASSSAGFMYSSPRPISAAFCWKVASSMIVAMVSVSLATTSSAMPAGPSTAKDDGA